MPKQSVQIAMNQRLSGDHFGKEHSVRGHLPQKVAAMPVSPIHHRSNTQTAVKCVFTFSHKISVFSVFFGKTQFPDLSQNFTIIRIVVSRKCDKTRTT
jgi:hypothetical protein